MVKRPTPRLERLLIRVRRLTRPRGSKRRLADFLGVAAPRLAEWLNGTFEPGGETTLQLLEWADAEEAPQKKSAGRVAARPTPKAQVRNSSRNEKPNSGRSKT